MRSCLNERDASIASPEWGKRFYPLELGKKSLNLRIEGGNTENR